jgi:alkylhydroperoxidase/carboxymuconolactone decarboxylase family protein YurZ
MANLHGDRGVKGYAAPENPFTNRLYPMTIPYGYGEIWHRPGLELRQRAMVSLAGFTALQMPDQLKKFGPSAPNVGLTLDEVCEAIIQTAPYSGYAPALNALRWLSEVC